MKKLAKIVGLLIGGLVVLALLAVGSIYVVSVLRLGRTLNVQAETISVPSDPAALERGRHLAFAIGKCAECHGVDLSGKVFIDSPALGRIIAPNLTRGRGGVGDGSDADLVRAIRHGVGRDGRPLLIMPSEEYYYFSDSDLGAVIAYLKSLPPVDNELPSNELRPLGRALVAFGEIKPSADTIDHTAPRPTAPPPGVTAAYGAYLAETGGCRGCHGPGLSGGPLPGGPPDTPVPTNISPAGIGSWTEADFFRALRTGARPDGSRIDPFMPWGYTSQMTDDEIRAVWLYLQTVPPKPTGNR